jgi:hypothetical protein
MQYTVQARLVAFFKIRKCCKPQFSEVVSNVAKQIDGAARVTASVTANVYTTLRDRQVEQDKNITYKL